MRRTQNLFEEYIQSYKQVPPDIILNVVKQKDCGQLADFIASHISLDYEEKQEILSELHPMKRLEYLIEVLEEEIQILEIENEITAKAEATNHREYYLREQMRAISYELGEDESPQDECDGFKKKLLPWDCRRSRRKSCSKIARVWQKCLAALMNIMYCATI